MAGSLLSPVGKLALARGLFMIVAQMCYYTSLIHLELATATTLVFAGPLFLTILSIPLLNHKVGFARIFAVLLGFLGVILVVRPDSDTFNSYALLPVIAALFYALTSISTRYFDKRISTALISIYASCGAAAVALVMCFLRGHELVPELSADWLYIIAMGLAGGFALFLLATAYRMTMPSNLSPFEYFGIPFSFVLGWIFFDETPFNSLMPGALFIVAGGLLVVWRDRKKARSAA